MTEAIHVAVMCATLATGVAAVCFARSLAEVLQRLSDATYARVRGGVRHVAVESAPEWFGVEHAIVAWGLLCIALPLIDAAGLV